MTKNNEDTVQVSPRERLVRLHQALTQRLIERLTSENTEVDAATLNVTRQFLKDNGINWETTTKEEDLLQGMRSLLTVEDLPQFDENGNVINKNADPEKVVGFKPPKPPNPLSS